MLNVLVHRTIAANIMKQAGEQAENLPGLHKFAIEPKKDDKQGFLQSRMKPYKTKGKTISQAHNELRSRTETLFARVCLYDTMTLTEPI
jgi:hypothetical protein